jgi:hypothetical protein
MNQNQQEQKMGMRESFNLCYLILNSLATCVTVFTRSRFGCEALGANGVGALVIILGYGAFGHVPEMFTGFLPVWLVFLICRRAQTFNLLRQGWQIHSYYSYPWLGMLFARKESAAKGVEWFVCLVTGAALALYVSEPVGEFVAVASFAMLFVESIHTSVQRRRLQSMVDAELEQRSLSDLYRGRRDDL